MSQLDLGRIPLLGKPGFSCVFEDPQLWAEQLNAFTPSHICEPKARDRGFRNSMAMLPLGGMRILSTLGNAIQLESSGSEFAHLVMSYRGLTRWCVDRSWLDNWTGDSLLYVPPGPLLIENSVTAGVVTFVSPDTLLQTALAMVGPEGPRLAVKRALSKPKLIPIRDQQDRHLFQVLYATYRSLDQLLSVSIEAVCLSRIDDLILRLWILLLVPELRSLADGLLQPPMNRAGAAWMNTLADWIEAHAHQPLALTDLERQAGYSRRTLQLAFRKHKGCTPMQWVMRCRMQKARERLQSPEPGDSVASVARSLGFANAAAFARDFSRVFGERPSSVLRLARSS